MSQDNKTDKETELMIVIMFIGLFFIITMFFYHLKEKQVAFNSKLENQNIEIINAYKNNKSFYCTNESHRYSAKRDSVNNINWRLEGKRFVHKDGYFYYINECEF